MQDFRVVAEVKEDPSLVLDDMMYLSEAWSLCSHLTTWEKSALECGQNTEQARAKQTQRHESPDQTAPEPHKPLERSL